MRSLEPLQPQGTGQGGGVGGLGGGGGGPPLATGVFAAERSVAAGSYQEAVARLQAEQDGAAAVHALELAQRCAFGAVSV